MRRWYLLAGICWLSQPGVGESRLQLPWCAHAPRVAVDGAIPCHACALACSHCFPLCLLRRCISSSAAPAVSPQGTDRTPLCLGSLRWGTFCCCVALLFLSFCLPCPACSMVIDVSKKYFPQMAVGYSDPRVKVGPWVGPGGLGCASQQAQDEGQGCVGTPSPRSSRPCIARLLGEGQPFSVPHSPGYVPCNESHPPACMYAPAPCICWSMCGMASI